MRSSGSKSESSEEVCGRFVGGRLWRLRCLRLRPELMRVFSIGCFGVVGAELEGLIDLALGSGEVALAEQGDGEVVVVVGVVGVGGGGALKERDGVVALAAGGDALIVDDLGKRKAAGDEGEGCFGLGVLCRS